MPFKKCSNSYIDVLKLEATFLQGIIVNFTFDSKTVFIACISCLKLNSLLSLLKKLCPPSHTTSILSTILGSLFMAIATFVIAPIDKI